MPEVTPEHVPEAADRLHPSPPLIEDGWLQSFRQRQEKARRAQFVAMVVIQCQE